jgi:4'-phosphopantetheinyl transferase EntD
VPRHRDALDTPHGRCLIVELDDDESALLGPEVALAAALPPPRRRELVAGRIALRTLLGELAPAAAPAPIVPDDRGAPQLPAGWVGSISHKAGFAAALVAPAGDGFIGVDLELAVPPRQPIERRILTPRELARIREGRDVTLHFAIKEAIYKAIDPIVRRYVGFTEVELDIAADGTCSVHVIDAARLPVTVEAWWQERDGHWLATARGRKR